MVYLYHYTNRIGLREILEHGYVLPSIRAGNNWNAIYGNGVYLTSFKPEQGIDTIIANNYDDGMPTEERRQRAQYYLRFNSDDLIFKRVDAGNRDIYRCPEQGITLDGRRLEFGRTDGVTVLNQNDFMELKDKPEIVNLAEILN